MTSIEALWAALGTQRDFGGARRVDEEHPCDLYASLDPLGRPGLILVTAVAPPSPPPFEAVTLKVHGRADGRWNLGIWLHSENLSPLFGRLCDDLVESSRSISPSGAAGFLLSRLVRWRRLLEAGGSAALGRSELRGLVGELFVLQHCLDQWPAVEVIHSWVGPLDAPQDFALPSLRIEVKAIRPGASTVHISSADQLDVTEAALLLAVVTLASVAPGAEGISPAGLIREIRQRLTQYASSSTVLEFESRLAAGGYTELPEYEQQFFRREAIRFYEVRDTFPRLRRVDLPPGVTDARYEIALGVCAPFETDLRS